MKQLIAGERKTVTLETVVQALEVDKKFSFLTCINRPAFCLDMKQYNPLIREIEAEVASKTREHLQRKEGARDPTSEDRKSPSKGRGEKTEGSPRRGAKSRSKSKEKGKRSKSKDVKQEPQEKKESPNGKESERTRGKRKSKSKDNREAEGA